MLSVNHCAKNMKRRLERDRFMARISMGYPPFEEEHRMILEQTLNWIYDRSQENRLHMKATCAPHYYRIRAQRIEAERSRGDLSSTSSQSRCSASSMCAQMSGAGTWR